jgi:ketosteroid isomerase-like protein
MTETELVQRFVDAINRHSVAEIAALLDEDHTFIDSLGAEHRGRTAMENGWKAYFSMVPDYAITVRAALADGHTVVLVGTASGTYAPDGELVPENHWSTPAAWRARVDAGRVAVWQVFADNEPLRRLARRLGHDIG